MRTALRTGMRNQQPLAILAENGEYLNTYQVNYHEGEKYPHLVRNEAQPDVLSEIARPLAPSPAK
jgi:hypothetical protein